MTDIELTYFPIHGFRGLMARMVLDLGEINHSEKFMQIQDWPTEKPNSLMGFLPELKIDGKQFAQLTPMLVYLSKIGKMDKLSPMEEFKSGMMIQTATDAFVGSVGPAFGVVGGLKDEPRDKQCAAFHKKAIEGLKVNLPKIEALLKHFDTKNSIVPGKITVGDLTILALYMASQYFKIEDDFKNLVPSAKPIVMNLMKNKKLATQVEQGKSRPFCPY